MQPALGSDPHSEMAKEGNLEERVQALKQSKGREAFGPRVDTARELYREAFARYDRGERVDFEMFRDLDIGIRLDPLSWEQVLGIHKEGTEEALGKFGRSWQQLKAYYDYKDKVISKHASTEDYILIKVFGLPSAMGAGGAIAAQVPPGFFSELQVVWTLNDFPYYLEEGIEDHNVWSNRPLSPEQLKQVIDENRGPSYEVVSYVNPPVLMSVPQIWHAHVLSWRRPAANMQHHQKGASSKSGA